jgi:hypothetical protein
MLALDLGACCVCAEVPAVTPEQDEAWAKSTTGGERTRSLPGRGPLPMPSLFFFVTIGRTILINSKRLFEPLHR